MKFPNKINVLSTVYTITYCKKLSEVDAEGKKHDFGNIEFSTKLIRVYSGGNEVDTYKYLLHEIIHAIFYEFGIGEYDDERVCDLLAAGFIDTMLRNKL